MSTSWTQTAAQICRDALEHMEIVGAGETVNPDDQLTVLRALDVVLKELPLSGYTWPKLSGETSLAWSSGTPQTATLPADYYGYPSVHKTVNGQPVPLKHIPHAHWIGMTNQNATATQPTHFYVSPANVLYYWPIPTADPVCTLQYQKVVDDASATVAPDMPQVWLGALPWGVADEVTLKFGVPLDKRQEIHMRWMAKKALVLDSSDDDAPVSFSVDD